MSRKKSIEPQILNNEELYDILKSQNYEIADINQILKAKEAGFNMYEEGMDLLTVDLRKFREYITKNLEPKFNARQLRVFHIAFIKGIEFKDIADETLSYKQMYTLITARSNEKDIKGILKHRTSDASMQNASTALSFGMTNDDLLKYSDKQIKQFLDEIRSRESINIIPYLEKEFDTIQIGEITKLKRNKKVDVTEYITKKYKTETFKSYADIISVANKKLLQKSKNIFDPRLEVQTISYIADIIKTSNPYEKYMEFINKNIEHDFTHLMVQTIIVGFKMNLSQKYIDIMKNLNFEKNQDWSNLIYFMTKHGDIKKLLDSSLPDQFIPLVGISGNLELLIDLYNKGFSYEATYSILRIEKDDRYKNIVKYVNKDMSVNEIYHQGSMLMAINSRKLQAHEEFIMNSHIDVPEKIDIFGYCLNNGKDINKINFELSEKQLKYIISKYPNQLEISFKLDKQYTKYQMEAILKAIDNGYDITILTSAALNQPKCNAAYKIAEYNATHKRKINAKDIVSIDCEAKDMGYIVKYLISDDLDDNIKGYNMVNELSKKAEIGKENNIEK